MTIKTNLMYIPDDDKENCPFVDKIIEWKFWILPVGTNQSKTEYSQIKGYMYCIFKSKHTLTNIFLWFMSLRFVWF